MNNELLNDPIEILMAEHEAGLMQLEEMNKAILEIEKNGFEIETINILNTAINFINNEIRLHNESEELYLFPYLAKYVNGPTDVMEHEHRTLWDAFTKLKLLMEQTDLEIMESNKENIINTSRFIIDLLSNHIYKENNILFPMAKKYLSEEEYRNCSVNLNKPKNLQ